MRAEDDRQSFDREAVEDYVASHGYQSELTPGELALAATLWLRGSSYSDIAHEIAFRRGRCRRCNEPTRRATQARYCLQCLKVVNLSNYNKACGIVAPRVQKGS